MKTKRQLAEENEGLRRMLDKLRPQMVEALETIVQLRRKLDTNKIK